MYPGLNKFEIVLEKPDNIFSPGELICGRVIVNVSRIKTIRGLKVSVEGLAEVGWTRTTGTSGQMTSYLNKEEYFKHEFYLFGRADSCDNAEIQTGEHVFLFNFSLPNNIPSSFEHKNGKVSYTIKAVLERPWKFDHEIIKPLQVEAPLDLSIYPPAMNVIDDEDHKSFCCLTCFKMGSMKIHVYVPMTGFAVGETIEVRVDLNNNSTRVNVTKIELTLQQIVTVVAHSAVNQLLKAYNRGHTKRTSDIVYKTEKYPPFEKNAEIAIGFKVPPVPSSNLVHCNIISVLYRINIHISTSDCQGSVEKSYPIVIGTKSTPASQPLQHNYIANRSPSLQ